MSAPTGKAAPFPDDAWPTEAFYPKRKTLRMNDEGIEVLYQPAAHSDADSFVFFRGSDVVVAGDILDTTRFPVIDIANGGSIQGEIDALNKLIELAIAPTPFIYKGVGTYVIPGHGRLCEQMEVVDYRDMVVIVRDVIADMIKQGMTLDQIKAASPAKPYETQYGSQAGRWTRRVCRGHLQKPDREEIVEHATIAEEDYSNLRMHSDAAHAVHAGRSLRLAARPPGGGRGGPPPSPKAAAPIDLTGYWVSVVTEDWRYRMVTPAPGDYQGVPMTRGRSQNRRRLGSRQG